MALIVYIIMKRVLLLLLSITVLACAFDLNQSDKTVACLLPMLESVNKYVNTPTKLIRDGQVLIQRGDRLFDLRGQEVK